MSTLTPNYNLVKPEPTDPFGYNSFLPLFNDNMDKIDQIGGGSANQNIAEDYDDTLTYSVGDYVIYNGLLYKCDTAVSTAEAFDPTKWTHVVVTDEMGSGGGSGNVDDVEVNGVSVLDTSDHIAKITSYKEVTQAEYDALPSSKESDGVAYFVKDGGMTSVFSIVNGMVCITYEE